MRHLLVLGVALLLLGCSGAAQQPAPAASPAPPAVAAMPSASVVPETAATAPLPTVTPAPSSPTAEVRQAVVWLAQTYYESLDPGQLFTEAWQAAAALLRQAQVDNLPAPPAYPSDLTAAAALHLQAFPALEQLARDHQLDPEQLTAAALRAVAANRHDCHTSYLSASRVRAQGARLSGDAVSQLGLALSADTPPRIADLWPGGPAEAAGLRRGQQLIAVNDEPVAGKPIAELSAQLNQRNAERQASTFAVRAADGTVYQVSVTPASLPLLAHRVLPGHIGYVRFDTFTDPSVLVAGLQRILEEFETDAVQGWVLDLRSNGGGVAPERLTSLFVGQGEIYRLQEHGTPEPRSYDASDWGPPLPFQRPLAILVGPATASAAEIIAGGLQALGRATLVGQQTSGCLGQRQGLRLPDGAGVYGTAAEVLLGPQERALNRIGVTPDLPIAAFDTTDDDPQLQAAVRLLTAAQR